MAIIPPGYVRIWGDNFQTSNLDTNKWWTRYIYSGGTLDFLNDEWQRYRETGNHVMTGHSLRLTTLPHNGEFWPSGMIRSKPIFDLAGGSGFYFETRCKVSPGRGGWCAFWLNSDAKPDGSVAWPPEIDIFEILNNGGSETTNNLHCGGQVLDWNTNPQKYVGQEAAPGWNNQWFYWPAPAPLSDDFHTYSLLYERPMMTISIDGMLVFRATYDWVYDDGTPAAPAHILFDRAVGGSWAGAGGVDETVLPEAFEIDYVRVYQKIAMEHSTIGQDLMPTGG